MVTACKISFVAIRQYEAFHTQERVENTLLVSGKSDVDGGKIETEGGCRNAAKRVYGEKEEAPLVHLPHRLAQ